MNIPNEEGVESEQRGSRRQHTHGPSCTEMNVSSVTESLNDATYGSLYRIGNDLVIHS